MTSQENQDREAMANLFGTVKQTAPTGQHQPLVDKLLELEPETVAAVFCTGCGFYQSITPAGLDILQKKALLTLPEVWTDESIIRYVSVGKCNLCDPEGSFDEIKIAEIARER